MEYIEITAKNIEDALTEASLRLGTTSEKIEYEVIDKGSAGFLGIGSKSAVIKARKIFSAVDEVKDFLSDVFRTMDMQVVINAIENEEDHSIDVDLEGDHMGTLIGKRGQTLDSLQYLASLALNKNSDIYYKVRLDSEDYRRRRKETLENLARNISFKVKRTRRPVELEPMNPFERRIIHSALQSDKYVTTHSEGIEPYRHVVVSIKK